MLSIQLLMTIIGLPYIKQIFTIRNYIFNRQIELTFQIVGVFTYGCFILMKINYLTIAYMWGVFCLIPFLLDLVSVTLAILKNKKF